MESLLIKQITLFGIIGFWTATSDKPSTTYSRWMSEIADTFLISEITMPGTHNSLATSGSSWTKCQDWSVTDQLLGGVRFLDISIHERDNNLRAMYDGKDLQAKFDDILQPVVNFLKSNPSETVLIRVRPHKDSSYLIGVKLLTVISEYADWSMMWLSKSIPTLGQARGKFILLQSFPGPIYGYWYWNLNIDDDPSVGTFAYLNWKWNLVEAHLKKAMGGDLGAIYLTCTNGAGWLAPPSLVQWKLNPWTRDYLNDISNKKERLGIIAMDFISTEVIEAILRFRPG